MFDVVSEGGDGTRVRAGSMVGVTIVPPWRYHQRRVAHEGQDVVCQFGGVSREVGVRQSKEMQVGVGVKFGEAFSDFCAAADSELSSGVAWRVGVRRFAV